jgi:hypothetical protein
MWIEFKCLRFEVLMEKLLVSIEFNLDPEDGGETFLPNNVNDLQNYTASKHRSQRWIQLAQDKSQTEGCYKHGNEALDFIKDEEFIDQVKGCKRTKPTLFMDWVRLLVEYGVSIQGTLYS